MNWIIIDDPPFDKTPVSGVYDVQFNINSSLLVDGETLHYFFRLTPNTYLNFYLEKKIDWIFRVDRVNEEIRVRTNLISISPFNVKLDNEENLWRIIFNDKTDILEFFNGTEHLFMLDIKRMVNDEYKDF